MKRILALTLALLMLLCLFMGCKEKEPAASNGAPSTGEPSTTESQDQSGELAVPVPEGVTPSEDNARVFYEIFVCSFSDSNGDGIGDIRGIINRMDYLNNGNDASGKSLGIEGIWLTPIFRSPSYHKYDVTNFTEVDSDFGSTEDVRELAELCHQRNVKLILDLPINHTSKNNQWFVNFTKAHKDANPDDPYYDFYSYYTEGESAPGGRSFHKLSGTDIYYEGNFWSEMPELNFDNEAVRQAVLDVAKFWLDLGVDGFRFDAAKYIYFGDHAASVDFWNWYLGELRAIKPDLYTVAEVWDGDGITARYYPAMNCFNFTTAQTEGLIAKTGQGGDANRFTAYVDKYLDSIANTNPDAMYVPFIANHDTDRTAGYLPSYSGRAQMAANLLLLCPGSPFIYYGEEIGMRGSRGSANTDSNRRLRMVWGDDDTIKDPEGSTYDPDNRADSPVITQIAKETSLYNHYKKVILLRKANPEIARGDYSALTLTDTKAGGFISEWNGKRVCVLHNPTTKSVTLDLASLNLSEFTTISGFVGMGEAKLEGASLTLGEQTSVVLRAG